MVQKSTQIFKTNQQTQNDISHLRQTTHDFVTNIPFSLARRICTIVENENVKEKRLKELKKTLIEEKYPKSLIEASILRAKETPSEILSQPKTAKNENIFPFTIACNSNNPNVFPIIKQSFDNLTFFRQRNLLNLRAKHLILVGYSVGLNLTHSSKITQ